MRQGRIIYAILLLLLLLACAIGLGTGAVSISFAQLLEPGVGQLRLARVLLTVVVGAGLSVAGVIFQALLRNPLADPYVLGASSGAGLAAAGIILLGWGFRGVWILPGGAFAGALLTVILVYALARGARGSLSVHSLLLAGVVVGAVLSSLLMFLVTIAPPERIHNVIWWLLGNLQIMDWNLLQVVALLVGCGLGLSLLLARDLNLITLGEESAAHLGMKVEQSKILFFVLASLITGAVVASAGLIGFVGLIVPHTVRMLIGADHRRLLPAAALAGATFLVLADALGRSLLAPLEIPIGVVTALVGGPFFLLLLRRKQRA